MNSIHLQIKGLSDWTVSILLRLDRLGGVAIGDQLIREPGDAFYREVSLILDSMRESPYLENDEKELASILQEIASAKKHGRKLLLSIPT